MSLVQLTLIGKPGCHLCDDARDIVVRVLDDFDPDAVDHRVAELSILDDPALHERYAEEIPVLLIDGVVHTYWRVDVERLKTAIERKAAQNMKSAPNASIEEAR